MPPPGWGLLAGLGEPRSAVIGSFALIRLSCGVYPLQIEAVLPVVQRELLVSSRKWAPFLLRITSALVALIALFGMVSSQYAAVIVGDSGLPIFRVLTQIAFWLVYVGGALLTADSLATERREGTLGLLFLTDLKGYDVVLGKVTARFIAGLFSVLAIVPMLAIPMLMGGVAADEFWRTIAVLLVTLLFSASIGIAASVFFRSASGVFTASVLLIILIALGPAILEFSFPALGDFWRLFWVLQPSAALAGSADTRFQQTPELFAMSLGATGLATFLLLVWSCRRVSSSWQARSPKGVWLRIENFRTRLIHGDSSQRRVLRRRLLDIHPIVWLHSRLRLMPRIVTGFVIVLAGAAALTGLRARYPWHEMDVAILPLIFLQVSLVAMVACEAANYLPSIKQHGGEELILSTNLSTRDIVDGHLLTLRRLFRAPLLAVCVYGAFWLVTGVLRTQPSLRWFAALAPICATVILFACCHSVALHALNASIRPRIISDVAGRALFLVLIVPWFWYWTAKAFLPDMTEWPVLRLFLFTALSLANAALVARIAHRRLYRDFRHAIAGDL